MEWLELLNLLSDQQTNAVTQQQIEALSTDVRQIERDQALFGLVLLFLVASMIVAVVLNQWSNNRRIKKLEAIISRGNSTISQKRTFDRQTG
jgi:hypothetical protein